MSAGDRAEPDGTRGRYLWLLVLVGALLPSLGTLGAAWIAEDTAVLARVAAEGGWADWNRPWFGMEIVRFWRPVVTLSWGLQYALSGLEPLPLRLFNLGLHAGCALLAFGILRRLGGGHLAALAAGLWVAWFPEQGGTVTWLSGRTDLLSGFFLMASVAVALGRAPWFALPLAFLGAASKEFGFLAPAWCALFALARGDGRRTALARALPALLAVGLAFAWRWLALGSSVGGYAGGTSLSFRALGGVARALLAQPSVGPAALALALVVLLGRLGGASSWRALLALGAAALLALVPLVPLLGDGVLEPQNARLFFVPFLALACLAGMAVARLPLAVRHAPAVLLAGLLVVPAWRDTHEWARAAEECTRRVEAARTALAGLAPRAAPALFVDFPESFEGAYALKFGLAERFRAPFPAAPRPVWPWRLLLVADAARTRAPLVAPRAGGALLPLDDPAATARLELTVEGAVPTALELDGRVLARGEDRSSALEIGAAPPDATLELVVFTELGYEPVLLGPVAADGRVRTTLRQVLAVSNGVTNALGVLDFAHDLGARRAFLEFRALGADGAVLAASAWTELVWPDDIRRR